MYGKVLKVSSNDLYGNVDDRIVRLYACFRHIKYNNNYAVFSFEGDDNKLYFGSIHIKKGSLVVFSVKNNINEYILSFLDEYISSQLKEFELLKIDNIEKVELVSYNDMEYDNLLTLNEISIPKKEVKEEVVVKKNKYSFLYVMIFLLVLLALGLTIVYLKPEWFKVKYNVLECTNKLYDKELELYYDINENVTFDEKNRLEKIDVTRTYTFLDVNSYYQFKDNNEHDKYFNFGGEYKYIDEELKIKIFYEDSTVIDDYDEMLVYLKGKGFSCVNKEYEK